MSVVWRSIASVVVAIGFVLIVGAIEIRAQANELGLFLDWSNNAIAMTTAEAPVVQRIAVALICVLIAYAYLMQKRGLSNGSGYPALAAALTFTLIIGWFLLSTTYPFENAIGMTGPITGWFITGALSSTTHTMAAILFVISALKFKGAVGVSDKRDTRKQEA